MEASASFGVTCTVQVLQRMAAVPGVASLVPLVPLMHACTPCTCKDVWTGGHHRPSGWLAPLRGLRPW